MLTEHDKAIVAVIMAGITLANSYGAHIGLTSDVMTNVLLLVNPLIVWLVPNKEKTS